MTEDAPYSEADVELALAQVRSAALNLPGVTERLSHGSPTFFVKKSFVMFHDDHHGDGRLAIWCKAEAGVQGQMVDTEPDRYFVPAYVGPRGWIGLRLDIDVDWDEVEMVITDAYRCVAPKRLLAELDQNGTG
ncbi:MAG TPA: MmcQ/YjbR family DNA-binding protein [Microthrixaceae bacterium]|nr:MmcQ/YjbR family DNA-binding protein [Microthrixaceae bacterium]